MMDQTREREKLRFAVSWETVFRSYRFPARPSSQSLRLTGTLTTLDRYPQGGFQNVGIHLEAAEILTRLVAFDTTSHRSNRPLIDFISEYLDRPGVRIDTSEDDGKVNLLARLGPETETGAGLVLCGHTDTVPAGESEWTSDPFVLTDGGDRWVGRGACDMKGFLALAVDRLARTRPDDLGAPLMLLLTSDEEVGSLGVQRFLDSPLAATPLPDSVLIGEPTQLSAVRLHKGHLRGRITFRGIGAHSGYPHRGVNAIEAAAGAVVALADLRRQLEEERLPSAEHFPAVPFEVLNVATVEGGSAVNVIPDRCQVGFGVRLLPGSDTQRLERRMNRAIARLDLAAEWDIEMLNLSPPLDTRESAPLHRRLCELIGQEGSRAVAFSSDAGVLSSAGCDCVLFGPGSIEVAHKPNEYLPKNELAEADDLLERLVERLCSPNR